MSVPSCTATAPGAARQPPTTTPVRGDGESGILRFPYGGWGQCKASALPSARFLLPGAAPQPGGCPTFAALLAWHQTPVCGQDPVHTAQSCHRPHHGRGECAQCWGWEGRLHPASPPPDPLPSQVNRTFQELAALRDTAGAALELGAHIRAVLNGSQELRALRVCAQSGGCMEPPPEPGGFIALMLGRSCCLHQARHRSWMGSSMAPPSRCWHSCWPGQQGPAGSRHWMKQSGRWVLCHSSWDASAWTRSRRWAARSSWWPVPWSCWRRGSSGLLWSSSPP